MLITLLIVRWSIAGPIARTAQWMKALRTGRAMSARIKQPDLELFRPLAREVATMAESLNVGAFCRGDGSATARDRGIHVDRGSPRGSRSGPAGGRPAVRGLEPRALHARAAAARRSTSIVPASGLVTALEPVLRACDGTWIAHGIGDADRETVDEHDRLRVPPDDPRYTLRRVWLTKEEEEGYYYGFANEGLWPLCHIAHTRPLFRASDWQHYQEVNQQIRRRCAGGNGERHQPVVLVQDYHFALAAPNDQAEAAGCARGDLLAHPVAESGGVRNLSRGSASCWTACWAPI